MRLPQAIRQLAEHLLADNPTRTVGLGPLRWTIEPRHDTRCWYFVAATGDAAGYCRLDQTKIPGGNGSLDAHLLAEKARNALLGHLTRRRPACVIHLFDDEISFARFCEAAWPSERTTRIRKETERELQGTSL